MTRIANISPEPTIISKKWKVMPPHLTLIKSYQKAVSVGKGV
ncbi:MAG: hypothetical protein P0Y49_17960 [Candidatus Pedobacter colombiensis]|uniref:Uncharacterized protein n=1 Tax=Candidatus Pedobacter colombiensis TaxID=3121371 RepID=A0AAJ6B5Z9_9SPHI|nr:hypothetical protein [Pedobacter sp.]WEK18675.1 MAG: hypothetical protein P0Y49_17960 [Pedobacter sp.]